MFSFGRLVVTVRLLHLTPWFRASTGGRRPTGRRWPPRCSRWRAADLRRPPAVAAGRTCARARPATTARPGSARSTGRARS